jgi:hypothetical protein
VCQSCASNLKCDDKIFCKDCVLPKNLYLFSNKEKEYLEQIEELKKENNILKELLIEYELRPPELGGKVYLEAKKHFEKTCLPNYI